MNKVVTIFAALVLCYAASSCQQHIDSSLSASIENVKQLSFQGNASDPCFDRQLSTWLEEFNEQQQLGADMFEADAKAKAVAFEAYTDCQNRNADALANDDARKD